MEELVKMLEEVKRIGEEIKMELKKRKELEDRILEQIQLLDKKDPTADPGRG
jgi:hypothetical protein